MECFSGYGTCFQNVPQKQTWRKTAEFLCYTCVQTAVNNEGNRPLWTRSLISRHWDCASANHP